MTYNKTLIFALLLANCALLSAQELSQETINKREKRKNLVVREWNTDAKGKNRWMDHFTTYDDKGRKIEEAEFTSYGKRQRICIKYAENGFIDREVVYDDRDRPVRIRKYEYNQDGTKKKQYNYLPSGKLYSVKEFEYTYTEK